MKITFSIVICTHNRSRDIIRAVDSVLQCDFPSEQREIIVVNNASIDNTREVLSSYVDSKQVIYIEEAQLGLSKARNSGIKQAQGKYIVFLDDDGEASHQWLNAFSEVFKNFPDSAACGGRINVKYHGNKAEWIQGMSERFFGSYHLSDKPRPCDWVPGGNSAWKRSVLNDLGGFNSYFGKKGYDNFIGGDESQLLNLARKEGHSFIYSPDALMLHHIPASRMTAEALSKRWYGQGVTDIRYIEVRQEWNKLELQEQIVKFAREAQFAWQESENHDDDCQRHLSLFRHHHLSGKLKACRDYLKKISQ